MEYWTKIQLLFGISGMEYHKKTSEMEVGPSHKLTPLRLLKMLPGLTPLTLLTHTAYTVAKIL